ncbi:MAG: hypothetical protein ABIX46_11050 [Burkholderiaceae bacterium]
MPIRTASLNPQIKKNGAVLHLAIASRTQSQGADAAPSELEQTLRQERRQLKEEKVQRAAKAAAAPAPKVKAVKIAKPKVAKEAKVKAPKEAKVAAPKDAKGAKAKPTRAEKLVKKADALEAAKKSARKSAKT